MSMSSIMLIPLALFLQLGQARLPDWVSDCNSQERLTQLEGISKKLAEQPKSIVQIPELINAIKENRRHCEANGNEYNCLSLIVLKSDLVERFKKFGVYPGRVPDALLIYCLERVAAEQWALEHQTNLQESGDRTVFLYLPDVDPDGAVAQAAKRIIRFKYRIVDGSSAALIEDRILRSERTTDILLRVSHCLRFGNYYWVHMTGTADVGIDAVVEFGSTEEGRSPMKTFSVLAGDLP